MGGCLGKGRASQAHEPGPDGRWQQQPPRQQAAVRQVPLFSYEELEAATGGWSESNVIGAGGFGRVYQGRLRGHAVAVKRLDRHGLQGDAEFDTEVGTLARISHAHIVRLQGVCIEQHQRVSVFALCPGGCLRAALDAGRLSWRQRLSIARGLALGLAHLHQGNAPRFCHRDVSSANALLEGDLATARLGDFGLARCLDTPPQPQGAPGGSFDTHIVGTHGYVAPECSNSHAAAGSPAPAGDAFAFGVVLLELLTGLPPVDTRRPPGASLLSEYLRPALGCTNTLQRFVDPALPRASIAAEQLAAVAEAAEACLQLKPGDRPSMTAVARLLSGAANFQASPVRQRCSPSSVALPSGPPSPSPSPPSDPSSGAPSPETPRTANPRKNPIPAPPVHPAPPLPGPGRGRRGGSSGRGGSFPAAPDPGLAHSERSSTQRSSSTPTVAGPEQQQQQQQQQPSRPGSAGSPLRDGLSRFSSSSAPPDEAASAATSSRPPGHRTSPLPATLPPAPKLPPAASRGSSGGWRQREAAGLQAPATERSSSGGGGGGSSSGRELQGAHEASVRDSTAHLLEQFAAPLATGLRRSEVLSASHSLGSLGQAGSAQHSSGQHNTAQHGSAQHSATQHSSMQHSVAQHSAARRSTAGGSWAATTPFEAEALARSFDGAQGAAPSKATTPFEAEAWACSFEGAIPLGESQGDGAEGRGISADAESVQPMPSAPPLPEVSSWVDDAFWSQNTPENQQSPAGGSGRRGMGSAGVSSTGREPRTARPVSGVYDSAASFLAGHRAGGEVGEAGHRTAAGGPGRGRSRGQRRRTLNPFASRSPSPEP